MHALSWRTGYEHSHVHLPFWCLVPELRHAWQQHKLCANGRLYLRLGVVSSLILGQFPGWVNPICGYDLGIDCQQTMSKHNSVSTAYAIHGYAALAHWPLRDAAVILNQKCPTHIKDKYLKHFLWNYPQVNATRLHWWSVNIGSGNGLVPSGTKPLAERILTQFYVAICRYQPTMS